MKSQLLFLSALTLLLLAPYQSASSQSTSKNKLNLNLGDEKFSFDTHYCSANEFRDGNLLVLFDVTASGNFRGQPAILLLNKSHPDGSSSMFQSMKLYLGELTAEQKALNSVQLLNQFLKQGAEFETQGIKAVQKKYQALFKTTPPDKFMEVLNQQTKDMNEVQEQAESMRFPYAISHGQVTVSDDSAHFQGANWSTQDADKAPELAVTSATPEIWVTCAN